MQCQSVLFLHMVSFQISEYQIQQIEHNISTDTQKVGLSVDDFDCNSFSIFIHCLQDTMSLPDIALYTFDSISDAGAADVSPNKCATFRSIQKFQYLRILSEYRHNGNGARF